MRKTLRIAVSVCLIGALAVPALNAAKAPVKKPAAKTTVKKPAAKPAPRPAIKSSQQLSGDQAVFNQEYTLGKNYPFNFIVEKAEYTLQRAVVGNHVYCPRADEKLLLVHFTVRNPQKGEAHFVWSTCSFTVVDANNTNHEYDDVCDKATNRSIDVSIKPAQKIAAFAVIRVPAKGVIPKLMIKSQDDQVLRYDLRGKIKGLVPPYCEDEAGVDAPEEIKGQMKTPYQLNLFDVSIDDAMWSDTRAGESAPEGMRYLMVPMTIKNASPEEQSIAWSTITLQLVTENDNIEPYDVFQKSRDKSIDLTLKPGQQVNVRAVFEVPTDDPVTSISMKCDDSHTYTVDLSRTLEN